MADCSTTDFVGKKETKYLSSSYESDRLSGGLSAHLLMESHNLRFTEVFSHFPGEVTEAWGGQVICQACVGTRVEGVKVQIRVRDSPSLRG